MTDLRQAAQAVVDRWDSFSWSWSEKTPTANLIAALRKALEQPEQAEPCIGKDPRCPCQDGDACHYKDCGITKARPLAQPEQEPVAIRMPKVGEKVICLEDESLGKVVSLTAGGSPDITFDDGSRGTYLLSEFAELFGYVAPPAAEPEQEPTCPKCKAGVLYECVACSSNNYPPKPQPPPEWEAIKNIIAEYGLQAIDFVAEWKAAQRTWVGLTEEDIRKLYGKDLNYRDGNYVRYAKRVEAELKERNGY